MRNGRVQGKTWMGKISQLEEKKFIFPLAPANVRESPVISAPVYSNKERSALVKARCHAASLC